MLDHKYKVFSHSIFHSFRLRYCFTQNIFLCLLKLCYRNTYIRAAYRSKSILPIRYIFKSNCFLWFHSFDYNVCSTPALFFYNLISCK